MSNPYFEPLQQQQQQHEYHVPAQSFSAPRSPSPGRQRPGPGQGPGQGPGAVHAGSIRRPAHSHHRRSSSGSRGRYAPLENIELAPIVEEHSHPDNPDLVLPAPSASSSRTTGLSFAARPSGSASLAPATTLLGYPGPSSRPAASIGGPSSPRDPTSSDRLLGVHDFDAGSQQHPATVNNNYASRYFLEPNNLAPDQSAWHHQQQQQQQQQQHQQQSQRFQGLLEPYHSQYGRRGSATALGDGFGGGGGGGLGRGGLSASQPGSQTAGSSNTLLLSEQLRRESDHMGTSSLWPPALRASFFLLSGLLLALSATTMWASVATSMSGGVGTLYRGSCAGARARSAGFHVLINILAVLSLAATNLAMQVLTAPTRAEVDRAHSARRWLEIGVMGLRNLWGRGGVDLRRVALFCALGLSTLPVQLLFNSGVWLTEGVPAAYTVAVVAPAFEDGGVFRVPPGSRQGLAELLAAIQGNITAAGRGSFERLDVDECVARYAADIGVPGRGHVVVVVNGLVAADNSLVGTLDVDLRNGSRPAPWVCGAGLDAARQSVSLLPDADSFCFSARDAVDRLPLRVGQFTADHCLVQVRRREPDELCRVHFSLPIMLIVILCFAVKLICVLMTLMRRLVVLATLGDAIASFLERSDDTTRNLSSASAKDIRNGRWLAAPHDHMPRPWTYVKTWKWMAVGGWRFIVVMSFAIMSAAIFTFLLVFSIRVFSTTFPTSQWTSEPFAFPVPLRYPDGTIFMRNEEPLLRLAALANLPQLLVAGLYLGLNSALTRLSLADMFGRFFEHRQPLTISRRPRGMQLLANRGLSLPWRYSSLLLVVVGLMGWFLSVGFGVVGVNLQEDETTVAVNGGRNRVINIAGFSGATLFVSPRPLLGLVLIAWLLAVAGLVYGTCFAFPQRRMPLLVGACSAALSAACHPPEEENGEEMAEKSVQWGVVKVENGVGCMAFSSGPVSGPVPGRLYI